MESRQINQLGGKCLKPETYCPDCLNSYCGSVDCVNSSPSHPIDTIGFYCQRGQLETDIVTAIDGILLGHCQTATVLSCSDIASVIYLEHTNV
ncbi:hypothetical protein J6590_036857 [Homalodisca vitripennis]|nr:hypothetical protein J6590_036857 [Homalodisca vitripennis]